MSEIRIHIRGAGSPVAVDEDLYTGRVQAVTRRRNTDDGRESYVVIAEGAFDDGESAYLRIILPGDRIASASLSIGAALDALSDAIDATELGDGGPPYAQLEEWYDRADELSDRLERLITAALDYPDTE